MKMVGDNVWLGNDELVIIHKHGTYYVLEKYEDYDIVFNGNYEQCREYCQKQWEEYQESIIG